MPVFDSHDYMGQECRQNKASFMCRDGPPHFSGILLAGFLSPGHAKVPGNI